MKVKLIQPNITSDYGRQLLKLRGVQNINEFLQPTDKNLQSWQDLDNITEGVNLIASLAEDASVGLIVDCDVDGFTSAAIIYQYLKRLYPAIQITPYLHEGKSHGLEEHWDTLSNAGHSLIIAPDSSSNDAEYAAQIPCPILVLDHHLVDQPNSSPNMVVINNQISNQYKNKDLSGAGVVYQFCRALDDYFGYNWALNYIDLAALGICGDMMSGLEIENQYFWHEGFTNIQNYFFETIAHKQAYSITEKMTPSDKELKEALDPTTVAFYIVPLINAMVRMGTMAEKERLFLAFVDGHKRIPSNKRGAKGALEEAAVESARECVNARSHQNKAKELAMERAEYKISKYNLLDNQILFIRLDEDDTFPSELNGLVAMGLCQRYHRPTIVARLNDEGYIRGSARGLNNCELNSFKNYLSSTGLFEYTQGHDNAFGCSLRSEDLALFQSRSNTDLAQYNFTEDFYKVDFKRQAYNNDLAALIADLDSYKHIWSQHNPTPLIYITDLHFSKNEMQVMGKNQDTLKIIKNGVAYMKFFAKDMIEEIRNMDGDDIKIEVVGKANVNTWMGQNTPQLFIEQYQISQDDLLEF